MAETYDIDSLNNLIKKKVEDLLIVFSNSLIVIGGLKEGRIA